MGFWSHDLLDLTVNWVLFKLAKSVIRRVNWPVVGPFLLLSWVVVLVRLEILKSDLLRFRHVLT